MKRATAHVWRVLLVAAVLVGAGAVVQVPASADGREVGGSGTQYILKDAWSGAASHEFRYGRSSDRTYVGDWNGDGKDTLAVRRGRTYYLSGTLGGGASTVTSYGRSTDVALVGDWNGDGKDSLAVRRGRTYYVSERLGGPATTVFSYGRTTDEVLVGDWNGDGKDTLAVRRGRTYYVAERLGGPATTVFSYGRSTDAVYVGDWDGDRRDTLAVRRGTSYYLTNRLGAGGASSVRSFGRSADTTLIGDWNGDRRDTPGVRRQVVVSGPTAAQREAIQQARSYLDVLAFSRKGLIDQLEYHGYSTTDAEYAVAYLERRGEVSWSAQAVESARNYLEYSAFSRSGLIDQLQYEEFTASQAEHGVSTLEDRGEVDWREQAVLSARQYLEYGSFSRSELISQLEWEGFSRADATYAADRAGL